MDGNPLFDDAEFTLTRLYTQIILLLRLVHGDLLRILESWKIFKVTTKQVFDLPEGDSRRKRRDTYLATMEGDVQALRAMQRPLEHMRDTFEHMRAGVSDRGEIRARIMR